jgi:hypothetical protein
MRAGDDIKLFAGGSTPALAEAVARHLERPLARGSVSQFPDGETRITLEESVRGADCFVIQSTCAPVNHNLMELLVLVDALRRASAWRINAVIPYFGYARQDKKVQAREPITAKLVANLLETAGADRVITIDLHAGQIQGFFDVPVDHLTALDILADHLRAGDLTNSVVVSPDVGRATEARRLANLLGLPLAMLYKRRTSPTETEVTHVIGDVAGLRPDHDRRHDLDRRHHAPRHRRADGARGRARRLGRGDPRRVHAAGARAPDPRGDRHVMRHRHDPVLRGPRSGRGAVGRAAARQGDPQRPPQRLRQLAVLVLNADTRGRAALTGGGRRVGWSATGSTATARRPILEVDGPSRASGGRMKLEARKRAAGAPARCAAPASCPPSSTTATSTSRSAST